MINYGITHIHSPIPDPPHIDVGDGIGWSVALEKLKEAEEAALITGIIAQLRRHADTIGMSGAIVQDVAGPLSLAAIDTALAQVYIKAAGNPGYLVMHPTMATRFTATTRSTPRTRISLESGISVDGETQYRTTHYLNDATGKMIPIVEDAFMPTDSILGLSLTLPYPVPGIPMGIDVEVQQEYWGIEWPTAGTSRRSVYVLTVPRVRFLGGQFLLRGITA